MKISKSWDCTISLEELVEKNHFVYVDFKHKRHKSDTGYGGICMYIPQDSEESVNMYIQIGISQDGFVYEGTSYPAFNRPENLGGNVHLVKTEQAIRVMELWGSALTTTESLESELVSINGLDEDCVCLYLARFHEENSK